MTPRNGTRLNLRIADEHRRASERPLTEAPEAGERVGAFLRAWREKRGWTIDQVAWVLRIRLVYLEAIEDDRLEELPGRIYVTGFIRSYARLLGVDEAAIVRHLRHDYADVGASRALVFPEPPSERSVPGGAIMAVGIMAAIILYGGWYYQTATSRNEQASIGSITADVVATAEAPSNPPGNLAGYDLPAAPPMQPPMRPPPPRTVSPGSGDATSRPVVEASPRIAASSEAVGAGPAPRDLPAEADMAPEVDIALASIERAPVEERSERAAVPNPQAVEVGAEATESSAAGPETASLRRGEPFETSAGAPAPAAASGQGGLPAPPRLPSAAVADAYASSLPVDMIPAMSDDPIPPRAAPSASAAWAGSVDRMTAEQWARADEEPTRRPGPVKLNAIEATWIEIREETGQVVTGKLLQPGDSYAVPSRDGLKLTTGNAGGLEVIVGGAAAPSLGPRGAVRRHIDLDGGQLLAGTAVRD